MSAAWVVSVVVWAASNPWRGTRMIDEPPTCPKGDRLS